ncbi:MAG: FAD-linked oxidase C-terminal domain-containing protein [Nitrososphaeria archaeon]|jgi:glycolate oxidase
MDVVAELRRALGAAYVLTAKEDLIPYARDASYFEGPLPLAVAIPGSAEEAAEVLRIADDAEVPVVPRGGGTSVTGSSLPVEGGIVVSTYRMGAIGEVRPEDGYAIAGAGARLGELDESLSRAGFMYPPDPSSSSAATVGGSIATNAGGLRGVSYGNTRCWVMGLRVVLPGGRIMWAGGRALKRSAGYDLVSLFLGSEGTLGLITDAILRIAPRPEAVGRAVAHYGDLEMAAAAVAELKRRGLPLLTAEFLDGPSLRAVGEAFGITAPAGAEYMLMVDVASTRESVRRHLEEVEAVLSRSSISVEATVDPARMEELTRARRGLYPALLGRRSPGQLVVSMDVVVPPSELAATMNEVRSASRSAGFDAVIPGHIGDGNFHPTIYVDPGAMDRARDLIVEIGRIALRHGGSVSAEHGIGLEKRELLVEEAGVWLDAMRSIRSAFDPKGIMNRGKVF